MANRHKKSGVLIVRPANRGLRIANHRRRTMKIPTLCINTKQWQTDMLSECRVCKYTIWASTIALI